MWARDGSPIPTNILNVFILNEIAQRSVPDWFHRLTEVMYLAVWMWLFLTRYGGKDLHPMSLTAGHQPRT